MQRCCRRGLSIGRQDRRSSGCGLGKESLLGTDRSARVTRRSVGAQGQKHIKIVSIGDEAFLPEGGRSAAASQRGLADSDCEGLVTDSLAGRADAVSQRGRSQRGSEGGFDASRASSRGGQVGTESASNQASRHGGFEASLELSKGARASAAQALGSPGKGGASGQQRVSSVGLAHDEAGQGDTGRDKARTGHAGLSDADTASAASARHRAQGGEDMIEKGESGPDAGAQVGGDRAEGQEQAAALAEGMRRSGQKRRSQDVCLVRSFCQRH